MRDELIGARDAALSESARLSEELRAVSGPNFREECEELQVARASVLEKVARLEAECSHAGAELDTLRHRTSSSQGEAAVELLELVAARDAALTETVRLKGELEATISANTCILDPLLRERDELVSARDEAQSEAARLAAELESLRGDSTSAATVAIHERDEVLASRDSVLTEVGSLAAELDTVRSQHSTVWAESRVERDELLSARDAALTSSDRVAAELERSLVESATLSEALVKDRQEVTALREAADAHALRHQELSSRYAQVTDELDGLRAEHSVACSDREEMRASLDTLKQEEADRLSQSPGPQPHSVCDVLSR